jgi:hypothetical protein
MPIAEAFTLQIEQNHGLQLFCPARTFPMLLQKLAMPLQPHCPPLFCPLSPEAYLLTREEYARNQEVRDKKDKFMDI